ncbi:MAG TPA: nucleotide exchange factor GrpE [Firmicutes bacterium]|nr:nucleotide exchange factor GrpE [Bacillota bacterium]
MKEEKKNASSPEKEKNEKKVKKENKEIEDLKAQVADLTDKCARSQAEVINFKRRKEEETSLRLKYCNEDLLLKFVAVVDNFERAINMDDDNLDDEVSKFLSGFKMMYTNMIEILKSNEVVEIECLGKEFDPNFMEAILVEHADDKPSNSVIEVLQKGYMYKDKLLRSAMVKIND